LIIDLGVTPNIIIPKNSKKTTTWREIMKDVNQIKETIVRIIAEYLDKEEAEVATSASFSEVGLDSLDIMELVMQIEEELDCKVELTQEITTVEKLAELIVNAQ